LFNRIYAVNPRGLVNGFLGSLGLHNLEDDDA
jgi:hypothetical protein